MMTTVYKNNLNHGKLIKNICVVLCKDQCMYGAIEKWNISVIGQFIEHIHNNQTFKFLENMYKKEILMHKT